jgi:hypothetical protein
MKSKAFLTVVVSILIGFILGFLVSSQITRLRTKDLRSMSSHSSFKSRTYELIKPTQEQKQEIDPVIDYYSGQFDSMRSVTHKGFRQLILDYHSSLEPYLTEEQNDILQEFAKGIHKNKSHRHPHKDPEKKKN